MEWHRYPKEKPDHSCICIVATEILTPVNRSSWEQGFYDLAYYVDGKWSKESVNERVVGWMEFPWFDYENWKKES